jgi:hypothetical protein
MAISLAYGVAIGTVFILIFFPVLIMLLSDMRVLLSRLWTGKEVDRESLEPSVIQLQRKIAYKKNIEAQVQENLQQ